MGAVEVNVAVPPAVLAVRVGVAGLAKIVTVAAVAEAISPQALLAVTFIVVAPTAETEVDCPVEPSDQK